jgi:hypothetical protein
VSEREREKKSRFFIELATSRSFLFFFSSFFEQIQQTKKQNKKQFHPSATLIVVPTFTRNIPQIVFSHLLRTSSDGCLRSAHSFNISHFFFFFFFWSPNSTTDVTQKLYTI